ncbi:MAG: hypothetical protein JZU65_22645, partial [Chlorobium sp.]|nr:hypothetical protein [Chlorobium sp.]
IAFGVEVMHQVAKLKKMEKISIQYVWNPKTLAKGDVSNVCAVVDKFFCDVLTRAGKITDDNYTVIPTVSYEFGGIDKINPRVVAKITEIRE